MNFFQLSGKKIAFMEKKTLFSTTISV